MTDETTEIDVGAIHLCVEKQLPQLLWLEAAERAIDENGENAPSASLDAERKLGIPPEARETFGAVLTGKKWRVGRRLHIRHLDGNPAIHTKVEQVAKQWEKVANIQFLFDNADDAEIRISYTPLDNESWSYIGTDALVQPPDKATMHYGWLTEKTTAEELRRVVLHEFGHALGMIHEHQHPRVQIRWNKEVVYRTYARQGWSRSAVDSNLFARIEAHATQFDAYDPESIMHYPVPPEFTLDRRSVGWNRDLSAGDKWFIAKVYPKPGPAAAFPPSGLAADAGLTARDLLQVSVNWRR